MIEVRLRQRGSASSAKLALLSCLLVCGVMNSPVAAQVCRRDVCIAWGDTIMINDPSVVIPPDTLPFRVYLPDPPEEPVTVYIVVERHDGTDWRKVAWYPEKLPKGKIRRYFEWTASTDASRVGPRQDGKFRLGVTLDPDSAPVQETRLVKITWGLP